MRIDDTSHGIEAIGFQQLPEFGHDGFSIKPVAFQLRFAFQGGMADLFHIEGLKRRRINLIGMHIEIHWSALTYYLKRLIGKEIREDS